MNHHAIFKSLPLVATATILIAVSVLWIRAGRDFWSTPDRRAQKLLDAGDPLTASETFTDPYRRGLAQFRAGEFKTAAATFAGLPSPDAAFNQASARIMLGEYDKAVELYDRILKDDPDRQDAINNRAIAVGRGKRTADEGGEMTGGILGADEIVFNDKPSGQGGDDVQVEEQKLGDKELRTMWLRQVQTTPGDFLRTKFAYQKSKQAAGINAGTTGGSDE